MCYLVVIFLTLFNHEKLKVGAKLNNSEDIMKNYLVQRENILKNEQKSHLGNDITLESHEVKLNKKLMSSSIQLWVGDVRCLNPLSWNHEEPSSCRNS